MATLQNIRTKAGLLVAIVIGLSLAAFILGDLLQGGSSMFQRNRLEVGVIDGESIQYPEFQQEVEELGEIFKQNYGQSQLDDNTWAQVRDQAWQRKIAEIVMGETYEDLGIEVSSDELFDMLQGSNPHQIVRQIFSNPETGQFDRNAVVSFLKNLETGMVAPDQRAYWLNIEQQIVEERTQGKYTNMVAQGLYVTGDQAEASATAGSKSVNFDYIALPHSSVADEDITITDKDLRDYYNANKEDYESEASRRIEYITYPVEPSEKDFAEAEEWINDIKADFEETDNTIQFVDTNSDIAFVDEWNKKDDLPEAIGTWIFDEGAEVGAVYGPYKESETFTLAKLYKSEMMPDSVEARHILLQYNTQAEAFAAQQLADSLKTMIENGADFAELARTNSADQGSAINGGELGWFQRGQMVKPFENAAFNNTTDSVTVVASQFGIHLIQTTDRGDLSRQVQVAYLTRIVVPSTRTYQNVYSKASQFAGENTTSEAFNAAVSEQGLTKRVANVGENDRAIVGLESARPLIRAAYEAKVNDILTNNQDSRIFELGDNFVIAVLASATEEGIAPFDNVKARVELAVTKEKKAELLIEKAATALNENADLAGAAALDTDVQNAGPVNFNSFSVPGMGVEPAVIGTVTTLEVDEVSEPIAGNNGVYVVMPTSVNEGVGVDVAAEKMRLAQTNTYRVGAEVFNVHRNSVEIEDKRAKFY
ncbi:peptidylprolyl isomerase [Draconibacterium halophilum]|uniref:Periplasmic chaperone PpiD n=1 Tax=Draconibacterium halophilum TaxID=2706887 RepID=A0A6C0RJK5_9BACT|nr:SurA N-terminal domain-containing protein [Draconibacterium halophilum]QIA09815.1 peptidylprolyl isomerase [Draconibacterium halophilum]